MPSFSASISAIRANQAAINTVANNIANAGTEGYHRQEVRFTDRAGTVEMGLRIGSGVDVQAIFRQFNGIIEGSLLENRALETSVSEQLVVLRQVETVLGPGDGSIHRKLNDVFADLKSLSTEPDNSSKRLIGVDRLLSLTNEVNVISSRLTGIERDVERQIDSDVNSVNANLEELLRLNVQIRKEQAIGRRPHDMMDQFQQKLNDISNLIDISAEPSPKGGFSFQTAGGTFHIDTDQFQIERTSGAFGDANIYVKGTDIQLDFVGGRIAGYQKIKNDDLAGVRSRLETFAKEFSFEFDQVHSRGIPLNGEFEVLHGNRSVTNVTEPLAESTPFEQVKAGSVYVSVTDTTTGERTLEEITFDPESQSLEDFANALNSIANLNASVSSKTNTLSVYASNNHRFDFAGRLPSPPDTSGLSGTSEPTLSGDYTGAQNDEFQFTFVGNGTIGSTDGLQVQVNRQNGDLVGTFDVGSTYEPGSDIDIGSGVKLSLTSGSIVDGESFSVEALNDSETTGVLAALGINSLFTGTNAGSLTVNSEILADPNNLATSRNGFHGNGATIDRLNALRSENVAVGGTITLERSIEQINLNVALEVNYLTQEQTNYELIGNQLVQEIDSISGVDPNEEMVHLLQYQKAFEANVRVISTIDQVLTELFRLR